MMIVKVNAGNDRNGNPRRGWLVFSPQRGASTFFDEGYLGIHAVPIELRAAARITPELEITPRQYRALLKHRSLLG